MTRRLRMIACEISQREVCAAVARSRRVVDVDFLPKGLHDIGQAPMAARLQAAIGAIPPRSYDAILLWYGLCNNGVCGLHAPIPLVIPRAHDCITLLLGSRARYASYFEANPGTFFYSPGWIERDSHPNDNPASVTARLGLTRNERELQGRNDPDAAQFLLEKMADWLKHYRKLAFLNTGVGDIEGYRTSAREFAAERHWAFEELAGDSGLLDRMVNGEWDPADFLVVQPGQTIYPTYGPDIIRGA
jgi:hypothetical protein